jgi:acetyl esterase/lipase
MRSLLNIEFASLSGYRPLRLDIHLPEDVSRGVPVVLWIHGGGYIRGSKAGTTVADVLRLIDHGIAVASVEYRLTSEAKLPAQVFDVKGAVRWLRANAEEFGLDANHIGAWGGSVGGHLAALLATTHHVTELEGDVGGNIEHSSQISAAVIWSPLTDARLEPARSSFATEPGGWVQTAFGQPVERAGDLIDLVNPIRYACSDAAPTFIVHSREDPEIPFRSSELLTEALRQAGANTTFLPVDGDLHAPRLPSVEGVMEQSTDFLLQHLTTTAAATAS